MTCTDTNQPSPINIGLVLSGIKPGFSADAQIAKWNNAHNGEPISLFRGFLRMPASIVKGFFKPLFDKTLQHLDNLLGNPKLTDASLIFMVGGFSESILLQKTIEKHFQDRNISLKIPTRPSFAVISGAVQFGFQPSAIVSRVAPKTFGIETAVKWEDRYEGGKKILVQSVPYCQEVFDTFVKNGESIALDSSVKRIYTPLYPGQTKVSFPILQCDQECVVLTNEPTVQRIGKLQLEIPDK